MNVFSRVHSHFAGKGSPDVYVDVRNGDRFVIKIISFEASGYSSLDKLERHVHIPEERHADSANTGMIDSGKTARIIPLGTA